MSLNRQEICLSFDVGAYHLFKYFFLIQGYCNFTELAIYDISLSLNWLSIAFSMCFVTFCGRTQILN